MPSASLLGVNMNSLVRDTYQANGLIRSHQQLHASSQTSLQKISSSSPKFMYSTNSSLQANQSSQQQIQQQSQQHMQFPPPPPFAPLVPQANHVPKSHEANAISTINPQLLMPQQQQQQQSQSINVPHPIFLSQNKNFVNGNAHIDTQSSTILMSSMMANHKNPQGNAQQQQVQHYQHYPQQQLQAPQSQQLTPCAPVGPQVSGQQQQVPMTTIMIPATAAAQLQAASAQIQQAAFQASSGNLSQPQILVFMIPYMVNNQLPPTIPPTPEQSSLNSTLVRQSHNQSLTRQQQQHHQNQLQQLHQQQQYQPHHQSGSATHSRAVSSLSNAKQEPEKFYIKVNFSYQAPRNKTELSFQKGEILHVIDTLQNNDYGVQYWLATRVKLNGKDAEKGLIPNKIKAEEIALEQRSLNTNEHCGTQDGGVINASVGKVSFLKRRSAQRSKSLCKDNWDNVVFDIGSFKQPTYERVIFKHPGFCRPVVIFGPLSDVAREKLLRDYPEKYSYPTAFSQSPDHPKVIRFKGIIEVIDQGKHALLDITPSAVEKINFVNLAPIVIFMKTDSKSIIKEFRARAAKSLDPNARDEDTLRRDGKSSRKLLEQSTKLEKAWSHVFTAILDLGTMGSEMWYRKLRETIENQQSANVWMSEKKSDKRGTSANGSTPTNSNPTNTASSANNLSELNFSMPNGQSSSQSFVDNHSALNERFGESLNITSKSTTDLLPEGNYGNRSQLRNAYAHSLAQKLARASSEPKLNGMMSDPDDDIEDDDDDDDDDEIVKKPPFPNEFENSSSVSSSNGVTSYGPGSASGSNNMTYQLYTPQIQSNDHQSSGRMHQQQAEKIYSSRSQLVNSGTSYANEMGNSNMNATSMSSGNYHTLPPMVQQTLQQQQQSQQSNALDPSGSYHMNQSMNNLNNNGHTTNVIDLARNHDIRGSAFQVYSDMNQNNYHYYNLNKI